MDIMIDTEFLSFRMDSFILSIGAVAFDVAQPEFKVISEFYEVPTVDSQKYGKMDGSVLNFWLTQGAEVKEAIIKHKEKKGIVGALLGLSAWLYQFKQPDKTLRVWSHGAACDLPLLFHTYKLYDLNCPWHYQSPRDTRTLFDLCPIDISKLVGENENKHNALADAIYQAKKVHAAWDYTRMRLDQKGE